MLRPGGAVIVVRAGPRHHFDEACGDTCGRGGRALSADADLRRQHARRPKQHPAGLAEMYVRALTLETYCGELNELLLAMEGQGVGVEGQADSRTTTVDWLISTHRVWLGTGVEDS